MHLHLIVSWFRLDREEMLDPSCLLPGATGDKPSGLRLGVWFIAVSLSAASLSQEQTTAQRSACLRRSEITSGGCVLLVWRPVTDGERLSVLPRPRWKYWGEPLFMMCFHKRRLFIFSTELQDFPAGLVSELFQSSGAVVCCYRGEEAFVWAVWNQWAKLKICFFRSHQSNTTLVPRDPKIILKRPYFLSSLGWKC